MSEAKHTPGPWEARTYPNTRGQIVDIKIWCRDEFQGELVCSMSANNPAAVEGDEAFANAHLIAAAPELLAACKAANALIDNIFKAVPWGRTFNLDIKALNEVPLRLGAAIAKAEGRQA